MRVAHLEGPCVHLEGPIWVWGRGVGPLWRGGGESDLGEGWGRQSPTAGGRWWRPNVKMRGDAMRCNQTADAMQCDGNGNPMRCDAMKIT